MSQYVRAARALGCITGSDTSPEQGNHRGDGNKGRGGDCTAKISLYTKRQRAPARPQRVLGSKKHGKHAMTSTCRGSIKANVMPSV